MTHRQRSSFGFDGQKKCQNTGQCAEGQVDELPADQRLGEEDLDESTDKQ